MVSHSEVLLHCERDPDSLPEKAATKDSPMRLDPDRLMGLVIPTRTARWRDCDAMLYALAVGATKDDLSLIYEPGLKVLPSFAQMLGFDDDWLEQMGVDLASVVHGGLDMHFHAPFPAEGEVRIGTRIAGLTDKGEGRGGILHQEAWLSGPDGPYSTALSSLFVRGGGGFGGDRGDQPDHLKSPNRAPNATEAVATASNQAALFRLLGDRNPLHIDPEFAIAAGFPAPILHGAATFGFACLTTVKRFCDGDPARLKRFAARFTGPVFPGEKLQFDFWTTPDGLRFRATAPARTNAPVLDGGLAELIA
jgi:acyl dehydratase